MNRVGLIASSLLVAAALAASASASAAYNFLVSVEGLKTGKFKGESTVKGEEGKIPAIAYSFSVKTPRDQASGQASGKRQYSQMVFTKPWGSSSPQFFQAIVVNELLKAVTFEFYRQGADGKTSVYQTVKLTNASIAGITRRASAGNGSAGAGPELEDISLTFQKIQFDDLPSAISVVDDWNTATL